MSERDPMLAQLDVLVGTWSSEAKHRLIDEVVTGSMTVEWVEGGHFLVLRSHNDHELLPDAISVIGAPESGEGLVMEYFDSRGVRRTYGVAVQDGVMRWWRHHPGFDQRSTVTLGGDELVMLHQLAEAPGEWVDDMTTTYRRRAL